MNLNFTKARYLARKFNLAGKNEIEAAEVEMYGDQISDLQNQFISGHWESDENRKKVLLEKLYTETVPHNLKIFNDRLGKSGSGFFVPSGMTWADLHLFNLLESFGDKRADVFNNYKNLKALDEKVRAHPNIAVYLARRPKSDY